MIGLIAVAIAGAALVGGRLLRQAPPAPFVYSGTLESIGALSTRRDVVHERSRWPTAASSSVASASDDGSLAEVIDPRTAMSEPIRIAETNVALLGARPLSDGRVLLIAWIYAEPAALGRSVGLLFDPSTDATCNRPVR